MATDISIHHVQHMDRGLAYGQACFETFRVIRGSIFCWQQHWARLTRGLSAFGIILNHQHRNNILQHCLEAAESTAEDCLLRLTISGGDAPWGLLQAAQPNVAVQTMPYHASHSPFAATSVQYPFDLGEKVAKFTADYAQTLRAIQHWQSAKPMHNIICHAGNVISALTANVLFLEQGKWRTPHNKGVLPGIVRQHLLQKKLIHAQTCPESLLSNCEAMVLTNSSAFLSVVHRVNGRALHTAPPALQMLKDSLKNEEGVDLSHV